MEIENTHPSYLTIDDIDYLNKIDDCEKLYQQEISNQLRTLDTLPGSLNTNTIELKQMEYKPRQTLIRNTEQQLRDDIQRDFDTKIQFERERQMMLENEIEQINKRITEYTEATERMKQQLIYEKEMERIQLEKERRMRQIEMELIIPYHS